GRQGADPELLGNALVLLHVHVRDPDVSLVRVGQRVQGGGDGLARRTPGGPEVDQDRLLGAQHLGLEVRTEHVQYVLARHVTSSGERRTGNTRRIPVGRRRGGTSHNAAAVSKESRSTPGGYRATDPSGCHRAW